MPANKVIVVKSVVIITMGKLDYRKNQVNIEINVWLKVQCKGTHAAKKFCVGLTFFCSRSLLMQNYYYLQTTSTYYGLQKLNLWELILK